jgi:hypothetical protein
MTTSRRQAILAALTAALTPRLARAGNVAATCPPPFLRADDPLRVALIGDLHRWAQVNRHIPHATLLLHSELAHLAPATGVYVEFSTEFAVRIGPFAVPWIIVADCGLPPGLFPETPS